MDESKPPVRLEIAGFQVSIHAEVIIQERQLNRAWISEAISQPENTALGLDGNMHYIKTIGEFGGRKLRVVANHHVAPPRIVTIFLDRRLKGKQ